MLLILALLLHAVVSKARVLGEQLSPQPCIGPDSSDKFGTEERRKYMASKLEIDLRVIKRFPAPTVKPPPLIGQDQVAFLFLTMDQLYFEEVWNQFFSGAQVGKYSIYVHQAGRWKADASGSRGRAKQYLMSTDTPKTPRRSKQYLTPLRQLGAVDVDPVETGWCALMGVEVALLLKALEDPRNTQFVFLAHDSVPLKKFDYVYRQLVVNSAHTSKFCFADKASYKSAAAETVRNEWLRDCVFRDFYRDYNPRTVKHHQWIVLSRSHAKTVVRRAKEALLEWNQSWHEAAPDLRASGEGCSDEAVPATALLRSLQDLERSTGNTWADFVRLGVEQQCLTFVFWRHCFGKTELDQGETLVKELDIFRRHGEFRMFTDTTFDFFTSPLKRELNGYPVVFDRLQMDYLGKLVSHGFMFARKFVQDIKVEDKGENVSLEDALPRLWDGVDELNASQQIWSRLSNEGVPKPV